MKEVTVLIPTYNRLAALTATLTALCFQDFNNFDIVISDQTPERPTFAEPIIQRVTRVLKQRSINVESYWHIPPRGLAEQRNFLLNQTSSPYVLYLDDDVVLESFAIQNMYQAIRENECGFVGMAVQGLSYINDQRPNEERLEWWKGKVEPETVRPNTPEWERHIINNAANLFHVAAQLGLNRSDRKPYKVAWVGGCVMFDRAKLRAAGGFSFWKKVPTQHVGEDVAAQLKVMERYGGCGILPSGAYHLELPSTITDRKTDLPLLDLDN